MNYILKNEEELLIKSQVLNSQSVTIQFKLY